MLAAHLQRHGICPLEVAALMKDVLNAPRRLAEAVQLFLNQQPLLIQPSDDLHHDGTRLRRRRTWQRIFCGLGPSDALLHLAVVQGTQNVGALRVHRI